MGSAWADAGVPDDQHRRGVVNRLNVAKRSALRVGVRLATLADIREPGGHLPVTRMCRGVRLA